MRSLGWAVFQYDWYPYKKRGTRTQTHAKENAGWARHTQRKMAAETGFMLPQAEEILELPEAKRGKEVSSLQAWPLILDF